VLTRLSRFGTTYRFESAFSYMTQIKNRLISDKDVRLEDQNFKINDVGTKDRIISL